RLQPVEEVGHLGRDEQTVPSAELGDPLAGTDKLLSPSLQFAVDLGNRRGELIGVGGEQLLDAGEWHAVLGEGLDLYQVDGVLGAVAPIARRVARRLREQAALVVMADSLDRDARVGSELADRDRVGWSAFNPLAAQEAHQASGSRGGTRLG